MSCDFVFLGGYKRVLNAVHMYMWQWSFGGKKTGSWREYYQTHSIAPVWYHFGKLRVRATRAAYNWLPALPDGATIAHSLPTKKTWHVMLRMIRMSYRKECYTVPASSRCGQVGKNTGRAVVNRMAVKCRPHGIFAGYNIFDMLWIVGIWFGVVTFEQTKRFWKSFFFICNL